MRSFMLLFCEKIDFLFSSRASLMCMDWYENLSPIFVLTATLQYFQITRRASSFVKADLMCLGQTRPPYHHVDAALSIFSKLGKSRLVFLQRNTENCLCSLAVFTVCIAVLGHSPCTVCERGWYCRHFRNTHTSDRKPNSLHASATDNHSVHTATSMWSEALGSVGALSVLLWQPYLEQWHFVLFMLKSVFAQHSV